MLQDDGHFFRVLSKKPRRQLYAFGGRQERDEEMMLAGQAMRGRVGQDPPHHAAKRVARQHIVSDMVGRHGRSCCILKKTAGLCAGRRLGSPMLPSRLAEISRAHRVKLRQVRLASRQEIKWRLLLPGASEPRLTELNPSGL